MNIIEAYGQKFVVIDGKLYGFNDSVLRSPLMVRTQFDSPFENEPEFRIRTLMDYGPVASVPRALLYSSCVTDYAPPRENRVHCINLRRRRDRER